MNCYKVKKLLFILAILTQQLSLNSQDFVWARGIGGIGDDNGLSIAADQFGNSYSTGWFQGTMDVDPGPSVVNFSCTGVNGDIYILKLDASGNFVWAKQIGGPALDYAYSVKVDASGFVYVVGLFNSTADFDPGVGTYTLASAGNNDAFVLKLDASGNFVWAKNLGGPGNDQANSIFVDGSGNIYTVGSFSNTADFDPGVGTSSLTSSGSTDVFVSKLDVLGNFVWAKNMGGPISDQGLSIAVDAGGNVYTTGFFYGVSDFDPSPSSFTLSSLNNEDIFISKLDASGNFVWAKSMGTTQSDRGTSLVLDAASNIYVAGFFQGAVDFDPGPGTFSLTSSGSSDIFISKLDGGGNFIWALNMGGTQSDGAEGILLDQVGNIYLTGGFGGVVDFDPGAGIFTLTSIGSTETFVSKLDPSGNFLWARGVAASGSNYGLSIASDFVNSIYITGYFGGSTDMDPGPGTYSLPPIGGTDIFFLKLTQTSSGVEERLSSAKALVFPNPCKGNFNIKIDFNLDNGKLILFNSLGQSIYEQKITEGMNKIETLELPKGLYTCFLLDDKAHLFESRIVIE
jgi:hypothetical protein